MNVVNTLGGATRPLFSTAWLSTLVHLRQTRLLKQAHVTVK